MEHVSERVFDNVQDAINAANAASMGSGQAYPGILYRQGGRRFVTATLPCGDIVELVTEANPAPKKIHTYNVDAERNRPLVPAHVKTIRDYLIDEEQYILPPILLNSLEPLQIFIYDPMQLFTGESSRSFAPCWFVLPRKYRLHVTDGQHRIEGLRAAMAESKDGRFYRDAVAVSIVEEKSLDKTHQDFFDAAQVKTLPASMLVEYDQREPLNRITKAIVADVPILKDRTLRAGSKIGSKSPMMFTNNMIRRFVVVMVTGHDAKDEAAASAVAAQPEMWRKRITDFLRQFSQENPQWRTVSDKPRATGDIVDIEGFREKYLHFFAGGLMIIGGIGYSVMKMCSTYQEELTAEQRAYITRLSKDIDWQKDNPLWRRSVISEKVNKKGQAVLALTGSYAFFSIGVADVKRAIGLDLTEDERTAIRKVENGKVQ
jgi:DGQHR domain-containing protein